MKSIQKLCDQLNERAYFVKLTFTHAAAGVKDKRKGYAIYLPSASGEQFLEAITFEPCNYSNGDKWLIYGPLIRRHSINIYAKNIPQARKRIDAIIKGKKEYYDQF